MCVNLSSKRFIDGHFNLLFFYTLFIMSFFSDREDLANNVLFIISKLITPKPP